MCLSYYDITPCHNNNYPPRLNVLAVYQILSEFSQRFCKSKDVFSRLYVNIQKVVLWIRILYLETEVELWRKITIKCKTDIPIHNIEYTQTIPTTATHQHDNNDNK